MNKKTMPFTPRMWRLRSAVKTAQGFTAFFAIAMLASHASAQPTQPVGASEVTKKLNAELLKELPFEDRSSYEDARRGLIAQASDLASTTESGRQVFSNEGFEFLGGKEVPSTVNPSLWRQAQLNSIAGLFKISDRVYQVRGTDLSNITIIEGDAGLIIIDPLFTPEAAKFAMDLYYSRRPMRTVHTVVYTHSHPDHYGGVSGIVSEADVKSGKVKIIAPDQFLEAAVSENILAGNAQARRLQYQFGFFLPRGEKGYIDTGLGKDLSRGVISLFAPTDAIKEPIERRRIDGVDVDFVMVPGTEAPAEIVMYFPQFKMLQMAEIATQTMHNIYTLRGAEVRDANVWSKNLNRVLQKYGDVSEVIIASHHWPTWGKEKGKEYLSKQRDLYKFIHDQSLRMINHGYLPAEIADTLRLPKGLATEWSARGYYGTLSHNARAVYQKYIGFYSSNPSDLNPLPPVPAARKTVEYMGGAAAVVERARADYDKGEYRWVAQVLNNVVYADPDNKNAKDLLASALEQLAYQSESGIWRNQYLSGAYELRNGIPKLPNVKTGSPDTIKALSLDMVFDYMGVRLNGAKAEGKKIVVNWVFPDTNQTYALNLENSALTYTPDTQAAKADATLTLDRGVLNGILLRQTSFEEAVESKQIKVAGDPAKFTELLNLLDDFDVMFGVVTPERGKL